MESSPPRSIRRSSLWAVGLGLCLVLDLGITWVHPDADPPTEYSNDFSQLIDGYWYLAEAKSWVTGEPLAIGDEYRRPLITWPAYAFYRLGGISFPSSRLLSSLASVCTILLVALLLRRRFGDAAALLGAFFLAIDPAWHAYVRSPVIYPWAAFWLLSTLAIGSGAPWRRWCAGVVLALALGFLLKSIIWLALPALLFDGWMRVRGLAFGRRRLAWALPLAAGVLALVLLGPWFVERYWPRIELYAGFGTGWPLSNLWRFEDRSQILSAFPLLLPAAWLALVSASGLLFRNRPALPAFERAALVTAWSFIALSAVCEYAPLRYLLVIEPLLIVGVVRLLVELRASAKPQVVRYSDLRPAGLAVTGVIGGYLLLESVLAARASGIPWTATSLCATLVFVGCAAGTLARPRMFATGRLAAATFVLALLAGAVPRTGAMLGTPDTTLARASRQVAAVLPGDAVLFGGFAHALATENALAAKSVFSLRYGGGALREGLARLGCSHLLREDVTSDRMLVIFEREGIRLDVVDQYWIAGHLVHLYRFQDATVARSTYEEGLALAAAGEFGAARAKFLAVVAATPDCSAAWVRLGRLALQSGDPEQGFRCYREALAHDPHCHLAHAELGTLFAQSGYAAEATEHLGRASAQAPDNPDYRKLLEDVRSRRAAAGKP